MEIYPLNKEPVALAILNIQILNFSSNPDMKDKISSMFVQSLI